MWASGVSDWLMHGHFEIIPITEHLRLFLMEIFPDANITIKMYRVYFK